MTCCLGTARSDGACVSPTFPGIHTYDILTFNTNYDVQQVTHMWKYANTHACKCCQKRKTKHKTPHEYQPLVRPPAHIRIKWNSWGRFSLLYLFFLFFFNTAVRMINYTIEEYRALGKWMMQKADLYASHRRHCWDWNGWEIFTVISKRRHFMLAEHSTDEQTSDCHSTWHTRA